MQELKAYAMPGALAVLLREKPLILAVSEFDVNRALAETTRAIEENLPTDSDTVTKAMGFGSMKVLVGREAANFLATQVLQLLKDDGELPT